MFRDGKCVVESVASQESITYTISDDLDKGPGDMALTKTCSAGGGGSGVGLKKSGWKGKIACSFDLVSLAAYTDVGERVRKERRRLAVTLPADVQVSSVLVLRRRIMVWCRFRQIKYK